MMRRRSVLPAPAVLAACAFVPACVDIDKGSLTGITPPDGDNQTVLSFQIASAGSTHTCVLANGGRALCWGTLGTLGNGTSDESTTPVRVEGPQTFRELSLSSFTCGITTNDQPWCWGANLGGTIGDGTTSDRTLPTEVQTSHRFVEITTGAVHACGLTAEGELHCWGSNRWDQLTGHPDTLSLVPVAVASALRFATVDAGGLRTCGIEISGDTWCWGDGIGPDPVRVDGSVPFVTLTVGGTHACGLTAEGRAFCFGPNPEGQLGDGTFEGISITGPPVAVQTEERFTALSAGETHTCGVTAEGEAWCWGRDDHGQLGDGDPPGEVDVVKKAAPTRVTPTNSFLRFASITAGRFNSCATTADGRGLCWGRGTGNPDRSTSSEPVQIGG